MRLVGNPRWKEFAGSSQDAMERGLRLDALWVPGMLVFQPQGLFRGSYAYFVAMDDEKARRRQAWFQQHAKQPA